MNDFTKEELIYLFDSVDNNCECFSEPDYAYEIRDKLESLIDNHPNETDWIKRQKPEDKNGKWTGQPWPTSDWALFKDIEGNESLAQRLTKDDYEFVTNKINVYQLCMFKELENDHPLVKSYLKDKTNWDMKDE